MKTFLYIFLGGGIGSVLRFYGSAFTQNWLKWHTFPFGTLFVNTIGCLLIGLFSAYFIKNDPQGLKFLFITGFCGGFTTFSTFSYETVILWQNQNYTTLFFYLILSLALGILATILGLQLGRI